MSWNWTKMFNQQPRKRALARNSCLTFCAAESLEQRAMMSAVMDNGTEAAEVSQVETRKATVSYPDIAGSWLFTISVPGMGTFASDNAQITQNGAKYSVSGSANGIEFVINGKFSKQSPMQFTGKASFDNVPGVGNVKGSCSGSTNPASDSITGDAIVKVAGQSVTIGIIGAKQLMNAPVQVETHKKPTGLIPDLTGNWVFQIQSVYGDYTLNTVIKAIDKAKTDFTGKGSASGATINLKMGVRLRKVSELPELYALFHVSFAEAGNGRPIEAYDVVVNQTGTSLNLLGYYKPKNSTEEVVVSIVGNKTES